jgi:hypothetical protein
MCPSFAILKKKGAATIRVVTDFRKLNLSLKRRMSAISYSKDCFYADMIRSMEGFTFASALDLNMGYYHIKLDSDGQKLCTIVFPWHMGKIQIQTLTHGYQDCLVSDVIQNVMSKLVQDMEYVKTNMLS